MVWFKVDDGFHSHRKTITAGTAAIGLWTRCGSWSEYHLTDGRIPSAVALSFGTLKMIRQLVSSGLWEEVEGGYQFHDFGEYNPLAEQVEQDREAKREAGRKGGKASAAAKQKASEAQAEPKQVLEQNGADLNPVPEPVPEGSKEPSSSRKRATDPPDFMPITGAMDVWAANHAPDVDLGFETAKMLDWYRSHGRKMVNWQATWSNWMRKQQRDMDEKAAPQQLQRRSDMDKMFG